MKYSNYDKFPSVPVAGFSDACVAGWPDCLGRLKKSLQSVSARKKILVVECYPGVDEAALYQLLRDQLAPELILWSKDALLSPEKIQSLVEPCLGGNDPVFGFLSELNLPAFFDASRLATLRQQVADIDSGLVIILGCGARQIAAGDIFVYADLARWEAQNRFRRHETGNLGADNQHDPANLLYKRAFFVDWRVADRWKRPLIAAWDFVLDTHRFAEPKLAAGEAVRQGLKQALTRPFRVVPFFDPAPWGGQWMKEVCDLPRDVANYGWCFDCVPEENSLVLDFNGLKLELPALDLVFYQPQSLLGEKVFARFGDEFPIRFDLLDTMSGGNLSLQVHPLAEYIRQHFGMAYTQDESYYLLDAAENASVYLGFRGDLKKDEFLHDLTEAQAGRKAFPTTQHICQWPARKHDHFLIPAGTVHCSGANSVVLEISATPYIFTFKLWDWARLGLDGKPRPISLDHGIANIEWARKNGWLEKNLINRLEPLGSGDGWREEKTGLHELEFIETRRHWFTRPVLHHTHGGVNVINLVEGEAAVVESPTNAFAPFTVHYAETFIIPATVGEYRIRPLKPDQPTATLKAFVRTS